MAYGTRWTTDFNTLKQVSSYDIRIQEDGYVSGSSNITVMGQDPLVFRQRGSRADSEATIIGTEVEFTFKIQPTDGTAFDDLFTASERQFRIEIDKESTFYFTGYMKPDNIKKNLVGRYVEVTLSFTDNLSQLKDYELLNATTGLPYKDSVDGLTIIKRCLEYIGIEIDFKVQLNVYESVLGLSTTCSLDNVLMQSNRFQDEKDGRIVGWKCDEVINSILNMYRCTLRQSNGFWYIINEREHNTFLYTFDWATLTQQSRVTSDLRIAIDSETFKNKGSLSYRPPLKRVDITFRNRNDGANSITNGTFDANINNWTNNGMDIWSWSANQYAVIGENGNTENYIESDGFTLTKSGDGDFIDFSVRVKISSISYTGSPPFPRPPYIKFGLVYPTIGEQKETLNLLDSAEWNQYNSTYAWNISETGTYKLRIYFEARDSVTNYTLNLDDVRGVAVYEDGDVVFDQFYRGDNTGLTSIRTIEKTVFFADTGNDGDIGALKIGATRTTLWRLYGGTEDVELLELLVKQILESNSGYTQYISAEWYDSTDAVDPRNVVQFDSKYFKFVNFRKYIQKGTIKADLYEVAI